MSQGPTDDDVALAARRLHGVAVRTPLLSSPALDAMTGGRILLKAETLQHTGSFKFRGAYNALAAIPAARRKAGVVAFSSGNHAQGVAAAAARLRMPAVIVMPADAPHSKRARTAAFGAEIVDYDRTRDDRAAMARAIAVSRGAALIPPYDDPMIVAGQGTVGREIIEDLAGRPPDIVVAPASGGGLMAGIALAVRAACATTDLLTAEPAGFDDHARSFRSGRREENAALTGSICDALLAPTPGELTFAINHARGVHGVVASDAEVGRAIAFAFRELKLVIEPGGAVALAAIMTGAVDARDKTAVAVLSGGNIDSDLFCRLLGEGSGE